MKRILFVTLDLQCDGAEKSLISLLNKIDFGKYRVYLLRLNVHNNFFLASIPDEVTIIDTPYELASFFSPLGNSIRQLAGMYKWKLILFRLLLAFINQIAKFIIPFRQWGYYLWKYFVQEFSAIDGKYDVVISYQDHAPLYYMIDKTKGFKKIGWNHNDYSMPGRSNCIDKTYYEQLDYLVTVSDICRQSLMRYFPSLEYKIRVINNIISPNTIRGMANDQCEISNTNYKGIVLTTVARLSPEKGIDLAVEACELLKANGYNIKWYVLGNGSEYEKLRKKIIDKKLEEIFFLMGIKTNPYPFIKMCDIYVQPSRSEAYGITIAEAKALCKPIVATDINAFRAQIVNEQNGIIVPVNSGELYNGINRLINNPELRELFSRNLALEDIGNESEILKFYRLIEEEETELRLKGK